MRYGMVLIALLPFAAMLGCGTPAPAPQPFQEPTETPAVTADDAMSMTGIDLYMHKSDHQEGVAGKPELWVRAESLTIGDNNTYYFENARAVIYGREDAEEVVIEALRGGFEQDARAALEGDVRLTAGTLRMLLSDIEWTRPEDGSTGTAYSESPVIIDDPDLQLNATSLRLYPDTREFELTDVSGVVRFGEKLI